MRRDKQAAELMRLRGKTFNEISKTLGVPKGTLSYWFREKKFENIKKKIYSLSQKKWSENITKYNKEKSKKIWQARELSRKKAGVEIGNINKRELMLIGSSLYWAEGYKKTKWCISFCNSDPHMIKIMMKFFREICLVPEDKFRMRLQIHPNIEEKKTKKFWSGLTNIPMGQFNKTQTIISKSSKRIRPINYLKYGTVHILIFDKNLVDKIMGWISGFEKYAQQ